MNRPAAAWFAIGPTIAPTEAPWPTGWEQSPRIDDGHAHKWESALLEPDGKHRLRVEEVVRCSVCHAPCCGESRDVDPCEERRHHRGDHRYASGRTEPKGGYS